MKGKTQMKPVQGYEGRYSVSDDGRVYFVRCGDHEVEGTVEEIERAVALVGRLRRLGVEVGHAEIRVPIAEEGD